MSACKPAVECSRLANDMTKLLSWFNTMARQHRLEEGQDIVEYALILPFLLLLTFSIIDGGWLIFRYNTIANAAREGARAGIIPVSATCKEDCISERVTTAAQALTIGLGTVDIDPPVFTATTVEVTINYEAELITGFFAQALGVKSSIPLSATATMQRE